MFRQLKNYISIFIKIFYYKGMAQPIKLLMLTHNYPRFKGDYAGVFLSLLAKKLHHFDIEPIILAPHAPGLKEYEEMDGVKVYRFRYADDEKEVIAYQGNMHKIVLGSVSGIFQFKQFLNAFEKNALQVIAKENIQVIAGHWLVPAGIVMKSLAKKTSIPMILSSHGTDIRLMRKYFAVLYRYLKNFCLTLKSWTVVSTFLQNGILEMDDRLQNILEVLPMPHDESIFYKDESIARDENLIVAVTRFTDQKRVDKLIQAFALVTEKSKQLKLQIYGAGQLQPEIETLIEKLGLNENISIHAPRSQEELRGIYNKASIVVLNSYEEGFGLALSESMLCGAAVIGTDSGGITDIIQNEKTGLLVPPDNPEKLSDAILRLTEDRLLRNNLAQNGHEFATATYQSKPLANRYAEIIKDALK